MTSVMVLMVMKAEALERWSVWAESTDVELGELDRRKGYSTVALVILNKDVKQVVHRVIMDKIDL